MKYKLLIEKDIPEEIIINSDEELTTKLKQLDKMVKDEDLYYFDVKVFNSNDDDITESHFIQSIINDFI